MIYRACVLPHTQPDESNKKTNECLKTIHRVGKQIVANKKAAIIAGITDSKEIEDKDLLSLLSEELFCFLTTSCDLIFCASQ